MQDDLKTPGSAPGQAPESQPPVIQGERRPSIHRAAPAVLERTNAEGIGRVVAALYNDAEPYSRSEMLELMLEEVEPFLDVTSDAATVRIACHLPVLESLFLTYAKRAKGAAQTEHSTKLLKLSLSAQASYVRTVALLAGLKERKPAEPPDLDKAGA